MCSHPPHAVSMPRGKIHKPHAHPHHPVTSAPFVFLFLHFPSPDLNLVTVHFPSVSQTFGPGWGRKKKDSRREGHASNVVSLTSFEWQLSSWPSSTLMLCSTQRLSIIALCSRSLPPPTPKATQKNGTQPSGLSCKEDLDSQYPAVQGSFSWISEELSRHGPNP